MKINPKLVKSILDKIGRDNRSDEKAALATLTFDDLYSKLSERERAFCKQLMQLDPKTLGFLGPPIGIEPVPKNLVAMAGQKFQRDGKTHVIPTQFLPDTAYVDFLKLQHAIKQDLGTTLMVESGYRSPACQVIVFLSYLELSNYDPQIVGKRVALPGFSQHGSATMPAIDIINQDGIPDDVNSQAFAETKDYNWLLAHANNYNFYLSYPEDNQWGVIFEPWHWQHQSK
jgi:zinc D-Ala-D-Ala carboxypeptidase